MCVLKYGQRVATPLHLHSLSPFGEGAAAEAAKVYSVGVKDGRGLERATSTATAHDLSSVQQIISRAARRLLAGLSQQAGTQPRVPSPTLDDMTAILKALFLLKAPGWT